MRFGLSSQAHRLLNCSPNHPFCLGSINHFWTFQWILSGRLFHSTWSTGVRWLVSGSIFFCTSLPSVAGLDAQLINTPIPECCLVLTKPNSCKDVEVRFRNPSASSLVMRVIRQRKASRPKPMQGTADTLSTKLGWAIVPMSFHEPVVRCGASAHFRPLIVARCPSQRKQRNPPACRYSNMITLYS